MPKPAHAVAFALTTIAAAFACGAPPTPADPSAERGASSSAGVAASEGKDAPPGAVTSADAPLAPGPDGMPAMPAAAPAGVDAGIAAEVTDAGPAAPAAAASRTAEECATLARWSAPHVGDAGAQVIPWMVDPFGDRAPRLPKKGARVDPKIDAVQVAFRRCLEAAKRDDPSQVVAVSMEHKPRGAEHRVCVKVNREEGREEVTRAMARCLLQAIETHAGR